MQYIYTRTRTNARTNLHNSHDDFLSWQGAERWVGPVTWGETAGRKSDIMSASETAWMSISIGSQEFCRK